MLAQWMDDAKTYVSVLVLSLTGSGVYYAISERKFTWKDFVVSLLTGGFAGLMTHYLVTGFEISDNLRSFLIGMAGYSGHFALDMYAGFFKRFMKSGGQK